MVNRDEIEVMIELPDVYDGVSVYQMKDGSLVNRWDETLEEWPGDVGIQRRRARAQEWIDARNAAVEYAKRQIAEPTP